MARTGKEKKTASLLLILLLGLTFSDYFSTDEEFGLGLSTEFSPLNEYYPNQSIGFYERLFFNTTINSSSQDGFNCIRKKIVCYSIQEDFLEIMLFSDNLSLIATESIQFVNEMNNSRMFCGISPDIIRQYSDRTHVFISSNCRFIWHDEPLRYGPHIILELFHNNNSNQLHTIDSPEFNKPILRTIVSNEYRAPIPVIISHVSAFGIDDENHYPFYANNITIDPLNESGSKRNHMLFFGYTQGQGPICDITATKTNKTSLELLIFCEDVKIISESLDLLYKLTGKELIKLTLNESNVSITPLLRITGGEGWPMIGIRHFSFKANTALISLDTVAEGYHVENMIVNNSGSNELPLGANNLILFDYLNNTVETIRAPRVKGYNWDFYSTFDSVFHLDDGTVAIVSTRGSFSNGEGGENISGIIDPICSLNGGNDSTPYNRGFVSLNRSTMTWDNHHCSFEDARDGLIPVPDAIATISNSGRIIYSANDTVNQTLTFISVPWITTNQQEENDDPPQTDLNNSTSEVSVGLNNSLNETQDDEQNNPDNSTEMNDGQNDSQIVEDIIEQEQQASKEIIKNDNNKDSLPDEIEANTYIDINWQQIMIGILLLTIILVTIVSFRKKRYRGPWR